MHDAAIAVTALLIGLAAGVAVTLRLTADRTGAVAALSDAARHVTDYHEQVRSLVDVLRPLRPPQSRGKFGEQQLELILDTTLPPGCWKRQHTFRSGRRVDTVVQLPDAVVGSTRSSRWRRSTSCAPPWTLLSAPRNADSSSPP